MMPHAYQWRVHDLLDGDRQPQEGGGDKKEIGPGGGALTRTHTTHGITLYNHMHVTHTHTHTHARAHTHHIAGSNK